jgi:preprotein translocase subunit SecA
MFSISVSDNIDRETYLSGPKQCYSCDVVYGEISQFQFDYLRDTYNQYGTRKDRKLSHVIVDEVDSMLIDDSSKIAKISSNIAGMDKLEIIYLLIWEKLLITKKKII